MCRAPPSSPVRLFLTALRALRVPAAQRIDLALHPLAMQHHRPEQRPGLLQTAVFTIRVRHPGGTLTARWRHADVTTSIPACLISVSPNISVLFFILLLPPILNL